MVDQLLVNDQATVKEGNERSAVFHLFKNDRKFFMLYLLYPTYDQLYEIEGIISQTSYREYLIYNKCQDLTTNNRVLPQRQYTIIKDNEIRMMDMQTTDALYY